MPRFLDRTNMRYGRLIVINHAGKDKRNRVHRHLFEYRMKIYKIIKANEKLVKELKSYEIHGK